VPLPHSLDDEVPTQNTQGSLGQRVILKYLYIKQHEKLLGCRVERSSRSRPLGCENATKFEYFKVYGICKRTDSDKAVQQISVFKKAIVMGQ
jgi:hypothetical protein